MSTDLEIAKGGSHAELNGKDVRQSGWVKTCAIILADAVGTGVLSLSRALAQLGWGPGLVCLCVTAPLFWLSGFFVMTAHIHVDGKGHLARSYGDIFGSMVGPTAQRYAWALVWSLAWFATAGYMLTIASNIQNLFYDVHMCLPTAAVLACLLVMPGAQMRTLDGLAFHAMASFVALLIVIAIALSFLLGDGASCNNSPPGPLDFWGVFNSLGAFVWAYAGISYYPEMLAEMKRPQDFAKKSMAVAFVLMSTLYMAVSCITYAKCGEGTPDSLVSVIPQGPWLRVAALLTIYHVMVTYLVSSSVLIRGVVTSCGCFNKALEPGLEGRAWWFGISFVFTLCAYLCSMAVPQFGNLNDLNANLVCAQGCLVFPPTFFLLIQRTAPWKDGIIKSVLTVMSWASLCLGLFLTVAGGLGSIITIYQDATSNSDYAPFACQALS
eukprot:TRINITY_DN26611_c0_g1_i1.p1 TRINITY_DN26611_c0_g1~~TRINITY_DN26611_c0_g1_i1.p1  ORF type:complete len:438 (+),score=69.11 TRINITY_DN26611_c0_g1_i1:180-1493(+)